MMPQIYEDYTDTEIEAMKREFDDWQRWRDEASDRQVSSATPSEVVVNAQRADKPC